MQGEEMIKEATEISNDLMETLKYVNQNSPFYRRILADFDFSETLATSEWRALPFTNKDDLSANNEEFLSVPYTEIADFVTTSGTTGDPVTVYLSRSDLKRLALNERDSLVLAGVKKGDIVQLMTTIDRQFMAGMAYFMGVQELEAGMVRIGPGVPELQWDSIQKYRPRVLIAVPSFILTLIDYAKKKGIDFKNSSVESIVCIGESVRTPDFELNTLGERISNDWPIQLYSTYASTEMATAFTECEAQKGCHLNDELLFLEVLDEEGNEVQNGAEGEIVITTLGVTGTPLLRYKTGDIAKRITDPCSCGKTSVRLGPIVGRKNQLIKFKGTSVFPQAIFDVFEEFNEVICYKVIVKKDDIGNDSINVLLARNLENTEVIEEIKRKCNSRLKVIPNFEYEDLERIQAQVYKKNLRKPEKIIFV
jgi:phenylacetate-CoA ligase|tara:strand:- start:22135 stop:23400 length:1266 start_codon:yes stop_codon:yes gene_type:complete